jgi:hypothetical protein
VESWERQYERNNEGALLTTIDSLSPIFCHFSLRDLPGGVASNRDRRLSAPANVVVGLSVVEL